MCMKKKIFLFLLAIISLSTQAVDRMVVKPYVEGVGLRGWKIDSILLSNKETVVFGHMGLAKGWTASGGVDDLIEIPVTGKRYYQTGLRGELPQAPKFINGENKSVKFELVFPAIPSDTKVINVTNKEVDGTGAFWYGVWLVPHTTVFTESLATLPNLQGKWFARDGTGKWKAAFYEKKMFWDNQFWNFKVLNCVDNKATLELTKAKSMKQTLELEMSRDTILAITANGKQQTLQKRIVYESSDNGLFSGVFSKNDSLTVSGYYQVVHPAFYKNAALILPDLISDKPLVYPIKFNADCTFSVKIPLMYTSKVRFSNQFGTQNALSEVSFMAEPGNHIILSYINENEKGVVFGGDNERMNNEMQMFSVANPHFVTEKSMISKLKDGVDKFIPWRTGFQEKMKAGYEKWLTTHKVSAKMADYMKNYLKYALVADLTRVLGLSNEISDLIPAMSDTAFYNNPKALYLPEYMSFLSGVKNRSSLAAKRITAGQISNYLQENASPTADEIKLLAEMDSCEHKLTNNSDFNALKKFLSDNKDQLNSLFVKYNYDILNCQKRLAKEAEGKNGLPNGFGKDLLKAHESGNILALNEVCLTPTQIDDLKTNCKIPEFVELVMARDNELEKRMEFEKTAKLPKGVNTYTLADQKENVIEEISKKYKGKVIYIDFWATWCGPCKAEFPYAEKHKENFKGKDVVFVYITDDSSPETIWKRMIATIPGEHYKLSKIQKESVSKKFNINSIPRYILIDKKGKIVSDNATRPSSISQLNEEISNLLK